MKVYSANASCDWGHIFEKRQVKASSFGTAFSRAGKMAHKEARKRPKQITITVSLLGKEEVAI